MTCVPKSQGNKDTNLDT